IFLRLDAILFDLAQLAQREEHRILTLLRHTDILVKHHSQASPRRQRPSRNSDAKIVTCVGSARPTRGGAPDADNGAWATLAPLGGLCSFRVPREARDQRRPVAALPRAVPVARVARCLQSRTDPECPRVDRARGVLAVPGRIRRAPGAHALSPRLSV